MDPRRSAKVVTLCGAVVLTASVGSWLAGVAPTVVENLDPVAVEAQHTGLLAAELLAANVEFAVLVEVVAAPPAVAAPQAAAICEASVGDTDVAAAVDAEPEIALAVAGTPSPDEANDAAADDRPLIIEAALHDSPLMPETELPPLQLVPADSSGPVQQEARAPVRSIELLGECLDADTCIDQYLWALYQRTPKEDTIKVHERRKVSVRRKGKMVTVSRSFTRLVNQDFGWKDPKAADRFGMAMMDYVIGGMDRSFKTKLFHALYAADHAGLAPGITSAFRDDYRQSIATGLKAATGKSYHGGSSRGGYGHGVAADVVSVNGATRGQRWVATETFWKWIDAHGKEFGVARPYLGRDPPHVGPVDGREYAAHNGGTKSRHADADNGKRKRLAMRDDRGAAKALKKRKITQAGTAGRHTKQGAIAGRPAMKLAEAGRG